ncbi:dinitrogenase iron-molybdenum cofactor biosynthesis protein [Rhodopseudomonas sp. HC1]|uniref:NifB/NifX family molybdenum-iron cluster-binding protein n=1 Tax=Rhodopseudomonas infernalis TaxID=2897386 RepID=UPI001EE802B0|nr:NifB/NifX family molybdenum-iron cluster-binding protein [Rhodopseudomonas infernalis]MCG6203441.1 dinitrogenase iron-molybdenum cofactor biosynthesis protein [Rhodopseudomonas infernalis]
MDSPTPTARQIKVAIATGDGVTVTEHFGYATRFQIWNFADGTPHLLETRTNRPACGADRREARREPMDESVELVADCSAVIVARIGECGVNRLTALGILAFETEDAVDTAVRELAESGLLRRSVTS